MPKIQDAMRSAAHEAGTVDHVSFIFEQGCEQDRVFARVVFQIGVLNQNEIANGFLNATTEGGSLSHVMGLHEDAYLWISMAQLLKQFGRAVGRSVVHAKDFGAQGSCRHPFDDGG